MDPDNGLIDVYYVNHKPTFCYIDDAVKMIQLLSESDYTVGKAYNIGNDDDELTMGELAQKIIDLVGKDFVINPKPATPGSPKRRCPSITKLKEAVSFVKNYPLEKSLQKTFYWCNEIVFSGEGISTI